ncbi:RHS repeat domain-containing protein [Jannaschia pohangensis]|uniref:RHS repeat-associated core domain-containing protein n=1 Tax=Jannaschia pohangensis TaxID=390807 RepID=A0A1I3JZF8_9RHOB|nr:RHS repeat-associated core domain-containing protein [Jannaschia pohangensis]SFI65544.1 RHS repeat-associated core domain-containing protein [Jannaschia pohangensis]
MAVVERGEIYLVRTDHIGRPVFATNTSGLMIWEASYLPFGGVHVSTGDALDLRFPGQWFQAESGLHQNWMRDYDPTTGRYMQADPLGLVDGASVYGYALQSPMRWTDPRGEFVCGGVCFAIAVVTVATVAVELYGAYQEDGCISGADVLFDAAYGVAGAGVAKLFQGGLGLLAKSPAVRRFLRDEAGSLRGAPEKRLPRYLPRCPSRRGGEPYSDKN